MTKLFKYLDADGAIKMLNNRTLQFTNATQLNDPFDCHPSLIEFSKVPKEKTQIWSAKDIELLESNRYCRNRENAWLCSLSKVYDSLLMWSYYTKHQGVCIGLDMEKTRPYLAQMHGKILIGCIEWEVQYKDVLDKPDYFSDNEDFFHYQMTTKAKDWEHEQEVRLISLDPSWTFMRPSPDQKESNDMIDIKEVRAYLELGGECFDSVYLGVNMNEEQKREIAKVGRICNPDIKIYEMRVDPKAFKLKEVLMNRLG